MKTAGADLRALIEAPEITILPGVHDTLSALVAQSCGAKAIASGGYSATASLLGRPDSSQLSLTELGDYYARIIDRVEILDLNSVYDSGIVAVSYTHLTLPTNREV